MESINHSLNPRFFDRDLSWLSFNGRVLAEAGRNSVPLLERIKFLSIFSSNLDEFYRVRMPVLLALKRISKNENNELIADEHAENLDSAQQIIQNQQQEFGRILSAEILPGLKQHNIDLIYGEELPSEISPQATDYFNSQVLAFLQPVFLDDDASFFPENNKLYFLVLLSDEKGKEQIAILNIPSDHLNRFFLTESGDQQFILFLDDIVRLHLDKVFDGYALKGCYSFKITRDAELNVRDEYPGDISEQIEKQLSKRDFGLATRFLYQPGIPLRILYTIKSYFNLKKVNIIEGGRYHNLKDLASFPVSQKDLSYNKWLGINPPDVAEAPNLLTYLEAKDLIIHAPYHSYQTVLRFFNEAAIDKDVEEIYVTLYRVASDSRIVNALISAAKNGKKVQVLVELKARFDEANNIKWAKVMKEAGVKIIYSVSALKVHAKIALVKRRKGYRVKYAGLLATGNFNESTAAFYTDHILFTTNHKLLREMEMLFLFLQKQQQPSSDADLKFKHLLVAQFNLKKRFIDLIDREIQNAQQGLPAHIIIKLNNLEEQVMITKLYQASNAGVEVELIIRGICCLIPGVADMSENITIRRIVDRYLEHGRVFVFANNGKTEVYLGSADWMNRNIYHRIEVCFPVEDSRIKEELLRMIDLQLKDNVQAVTLSADLKNLPVPAQAPFVQSQQEIYHLITQQNS